jgi:hypothetical protein
MDENGFICSNVVCFNIKMSTPISTKIAGWMKEEKRRTMMMAAVSKLKYYEVVRQYTEDMWNDSETWDDVNIDAVNPAHDELMEFLNTKIHELKLDAEGKKRFVYTVKVLEDTGDEIIYDQAEFKTSEEVYAFIYNKTMDDYGKDQYGYDEDPYSVPTASDIDALLDTKKSGEFNKIFSCGEDSVGSVSFDIIRKQINY